MFKYNRGVNKDMSGRENLISRINYTGGKQKDRMISDKDHSLKKALLYPRFALSPFPAQVIIAVTIFCSCSNPSKKITQKEMEIGKTFT